VNPNASVGVFPICDVMLLLGSLGVIRLSKHMWPDLGMYCYAK
jgi:hypothetical protein